MKLLSLIIIFLTGIIAIAAGGLDVPEGDPLQSLLALITNFSAMSPIMIGSAVIATVVQSLRKFIPSSIIRKAAVTLGGVAWAVSQAVISGLGILESAIMVLLTMGGAVAIYEWVIKPFTKKSPGT